MNVAAPQSPLLQWLYRGYMLAFLAYLAAPLFAAGMFAFNDSMFPALPWNGFTLDWFFSSTEPKIGMFHDRRLLRGLENSLYIGVIVSALAVAAGTCNAFLFERKQFPAKNFFYILMIVPLVIPGVILGISILVFASMIANGLEETFGIEWDFLRPGLFLVILGQFSFLTTITSLVIAARLRKFDISLEEAALNLGATRLRVLMTVTLPYLMPALFSAFVVAFLVSFENFNTTLMLVGSDAPLTITMYDRMVKVGSTPVLNAVSFFLMVGSGALALLSVVVQRGKA
ncbi:MAG: ABC transporter permease [Shinella sp. 65-6]|jgi:spermidine/putrescine transport system permease protein|uniref:ABC transporter permease n=1 Tax=unclassified Shinella TaxID=2643062 RepID=UPI0003C530FB|nr:MULTISPECIES: ABC transporter permease [unclassified Shinella]EYR81289.1 ABC-type spermidine/putrescine transport system permease component II [Shinella sp. DD12]MDG4675363.1 ABC transporter permease [Shinella sp. 838]OJU91699.1 MAG: ABC transporter permease [Shinella sp. 65-6]TAA55088.1 ABC transporter permease [Shinella sp. JR1-6]